ncbi:MAG: response regulator [Lachnospiraceae bacterium]|nr:response regulator [Lachnospiraceae bacterium]
MDTGKHSINIIRIFAIFTGVLCMTVGAFLVRETINISDYNKQLIQLQDSHIVYVQAARLLRTGSDILTEHCRRFTITGDMSDMLAYFTEQHFNKNRETAMELLEQLDDNAYADSKLSKALIESDDLVRVEYHAMALATMGWGLFEDKDLPDEILYYTLTSYEEALDKEEQLKKARELVFSTSYEKSKSRIYKNTDDFLDEEISDIDQRYNDIYARLTTSIRYQKMMTYGFVILLLVTIGLIVAMTRIDNNKRLQLISLNEKLTVNTDELQEKTKEAELALAAKNQFLSRMSNAIRNPINTIINVSERALNSTDDGVKTSGYLTEIDSTGKILLELVNDVLDLDRSENRMVKIHNAPFNMNNFLDSLTGIISRLVGDAGLIYINDTGLILHQNVVGDELHIRQSIINIVENAVKFTPQGGRVSFRINEDLINEEGSDAIWFTIEVEDTGVGMSKQYMEHIFEAFTREVDDDDERGGLGIGMSITARYVELMGGTIGVESELKQGSKFTIRLPLQIYRSVESEGENANARLAGARILVAEDNELNMEIARTMLIDEGATVTPAENGLVALSLFKSSEENSFDAILMDVAMPMLDGITVTKEIRAMNRSDAMTVPIIAMVAGSDLDDIDVLLQAGMNDYISKPVDVTQLVKTLLAAVKKQTTELAQRLDKALRDANTDALTGVKNRNAFELAQKRIDAEIESGDDIDFAIVICDVNGLKYVNDNVGHDEGNKLLINSCRLICRTFAHSPVFRIGGDEFVAILRYDDFDNRHDLVNPLMARMTAGTYKPGDINNVSFAIGMADYTRGSDTCCTDVFRRADLYMYDHKKSIKGEGNIR